MWEVRGCVVVVLIRLQCCFYMGEVLFIIRGISGKKRLDERVWLDASDVLKAEEISAVPIVDQCKKKCL